MKPKADTDKDAIAKKIEAAKRAKAAEVDSKQIVKK